MNKKFTKKDILEITLAIIYLVIVVISRVIKNNYYFNIIAIICTLILFLVLNVYKPLIDNIRKKERNFLYYLRPIIAIFAICIALLMLLFKINHIYLIILVLLFILDTLIKVFILKDKDSMDFMLLVFMVIYLFIFISEQKMIMELPLK